MLNMFFLRSHYLEEDEYRIFSSETTLYVAAKIKSKVYLFRVMRDEEYEVVKRRALEMLDIYYDGWIKIDAEKKAICFIGDEYESFEDAEVYLKNTMPLPIYRTSLYPNDKSA